MDEHLLALAQRLDQPTSRGLANAVSRAVRDGKLSNGTKLPPIRTVAHELGLSPTTVCASWALLARSGVIVTDGRRGTRVADVRVSGSMRYKRALDRQAPFKLDLSTGVPDPGLLPEMTRALRSLSEIKPLGSYLDAPTLPELIAVLRSDWPYDAEEFAVVDGAMDAIELSLRSLIGFGDRVVVEHPCFPPFLDLLDALGATVVGVPFDDQGLRAAELERALASPTAVVILQPRAQNPTGISVTAERTKELARVIARSGAIAIEDDSAGAVADTPPMSMGRWLPEQVLHVRSFSKSHGPDLRLAAISGTAELMREIIGRRQLGQIWTSRLLQQLLLNLLSDRRAITQVANARREYARRRKQLVGLLAASGVDVGGTDGMNIWIPVDDEAAAIVRLASQGIGVAAGAPFAILPEQSGHIRVNCGILADGHAEVAAQLVAAARAVGRRGAY